MISLPHINSALVIFGLSVSLCGAWLAARAVIIDEKTADRLAATICGANDELRKAFIAQSRAAQKGLYLIALGSLLQILGVVF